MLRTERGYQEVQPKAFEPVERNKERKRAGYQYRCTCMQIGEVRKVERKDGFLEKEAFQKLYVEPGLRVIVAYVVAFNTLL